MNNAAIVVHSVTVLRLKGLAERSSTNNGNNKRSFVYRLVVVVVSALVPCRGRLPGTLPVSRLRALGRKVQVRSHGR